MKNFYQFESYKQLIAQDIKEHKNERGYKKKLSQAAGCYASYLSQVLNTHVHLTPDHGWGLCQFWRLSKAQSDFFMALLNLERATNPQYKQKLIVDLEMARKKAHEIKNRINTLGIKTPEHIQERYYSSWIYSYVHVLICSFGRAKINKIQEKCCLPFTKLEKILLELQEMELITEKNQYWYSTNNHIHLENNSMNAQNYHNEWRLKAQENYSHRSARDIRYTTVQTVRKNDIEKIYSILLDTIEHTRIYGQDTEGEELICLGLDFFSP